MRGDNGLFTLKGAEPRKLRSIMLTQFCWDKLQELGAKDGCSRSDLLEKWVTEDVADLRAEVVRLRTEKQDLIAKIADAEAQSHQIADEVTKEKNSTMERLTLENSELKRLTRIRERQCQTLEAELAQAQQERDGFNQEIDTLHAKVGDLNLALDMLKEETRQTDSKSSLSSSLSERELFVELAEIIEKADQQLTGYTTKSFSRGLKDLKALL